MSLFDRRSELEELIYAAITHLVDRLEAQQKNGNVYSLVIYPSDGYRDLGISYSTCTELKKQTTNRASGLDPELVAMLRDHPDLLEIAWSYHGSHDSTLYFEVNACEWEGAGSNADLFSEVNAIISSGYDALYDDGVDNSAICHFFETMLTGILRQIRSSRMLSSAAFADDVLLGVQFPDSGNSDTVKRVSKAVNSLNWHNKVCAGYG